MQHISTTKLEGAESFDKKGPWALTCQLEAFGLNDSACWVKVLNLSVIYLLPYCIVLWCSSLCSIVLYDIRIFIISNYSNHIIVICYMISYNIIAYCITVCDIVLYYNL